MKKYLSVFSLIARESQYRIAVLWLVSFILQAAIVTADVKRVLSVYDIPSPEMLFSRAYNSVIPLIFYFTLVLTAVLLCKTGMQFNSKTGYTLRRLLIGEKSVFFLQTAYNTLMLFLFFVLSAVLYFFLLSEAVKLFPEKYITVQTVFKTFYESNFLSNVFSGRDILRAVRNIFTVFSLGINYAAFSYLFRRGRKWAVSLIYTAVCYILFVHGQSLTDLSFDVGFLSAAVILIFAALAGVFARGEQYDS